MFFYFPERLSFFHWGKYLAYKDTTEENNDKNTTTDRFSKDKFGNANNELPRYDKDGPD